MIKTKKTWLRVKKINEIKINIKKLFERVKMRKKPRKFELRKGNFRVVLESGQVRFPTWEPSPCDLVIIRGNIFMSKTQISEQKEERKLKTGGC